MPAFFIAKLSPLKTVNKRLDLCGISRILIWIFLHRRRSRFYSAPPLGGESERAIFAFFTPVSRKHTQFPQGGLDAFVRRFRHME
jgi:hypothetical protein